MASLEELTVFGNPIIFEQWKQVARDVANLSSIVQNDMTIDRDQLRDFKLGFTQAQQRLDKAYKDTMSHIRGANEWPEWEK